MEYVELTQESIDPYESSKEENKSFLNRILDTVAEKILKAEIVQVPFNDLNVPYDIKLSKDLRDIGFVEKIIKLNGINQTAQVRKFTAVIMKKDGVYIFNYGHQATKLTKLSKIENPYKTLKDWIRYFDKI
jgi:hypothetical protein